MELPVNVADDSNRRRDMDNIALAHQYFFGFLADLADQSLAEKLFVAKTIDARIEVERCHPLSKEGDDGLNMGCGANTWGMQNVQDVPVAAYLNEGNAGDYWTIDYCNSCALYH